MSGAGDSVPLFAPEELAAMAAEVAADQRELDEWVKQLQTPKAKAYILPVFRALENVIKLVPLVALYLYRQSDQPPSLRTTSGTPMQDIDEIAWVDATPDRGSLHAIGVNCEAIDKGAAYAQMIFLHELTHIFGGGGHSAEFHQVLDRLIEQFNRRTGGHIVNDYCK